MKFIPKTFVDERRLKAPAKFQRIDAGQSPTGAITEFCRGCMQTHSDVSDCPLRKCPLFPYRPGADKPDATQRRPGIDIPSPEEYAELIAAKVATMSTDGGAALAAYRRRQKDPGAMLSSEELEEEAEAGGNTYIEDSMALDGEEV